VFDIILQIGAGLLVGFLIGLTGMGGGALMTPFLLIVMKLNPILAVGTDLTFAAITKIVGSIQHRRENNISLRRVAWMAVGSLPASFLAAQFILRQPDENSPLIEESLPTILGITLIVVSLIILARITRLLGPKQQIEIRWPSRNDRYWHCGRCLGRADLLRRRDGNHGFITHFFLDPTQPNGGDGCFTWGDACDRPRADVRVRRGSELAPGGVDADRVAARSVAGCARR
jgi:hypothetical protein